ncbi:MAG: FAD-dependent oxidoreductase, partial [Ruminococcaceae bacterium]|nr:FAD-dependent oxidoreductase [Oscillospiraceae bacterium]
DILEGRRFEDGICLVTFKVDVHKLKSDDTTDCNRGYHTQPYHIPFRCLVPKKCNNLLLAGRCISGDFYPHASYRVMGNMTATGEACGFAAAVCVRESLSPKAFDGRRAKAFMAERGYTL